MNIIKLEKIVQSMMLCLSKSHMCIWVAELFHAETQKSKISTHLATREPQIVYVLTTKACELYQQKHQDYGETNTEFPIFFPNQKMRPVPATLTQCFLANVRLKLRIRLATSG